MNIPQTFFYPPDEATSPADDRRPLVAAYIVTFLKPEMLHVYRQLTAIERFRTVVLTQKRELPETFPFENLVLLPKPRTHQWRRFWQKQLLQRPITIYRFEARRILNTLQQTGAQLLHIYFGHIGIHLLPLLDICDLPVVVSFHGADAQVHMERPAHLAAMRRVMKRATLLLVRSHSIAERLIALGAPESKIRLHRTGIPSIPFEQRHAPADGAWQCVQACRLIPKKGLATSLRAFAIFTRTHPSAILTIAGEGPELKALQLLAGELGIQEKIIFSGFLAQDALRALNARSHLFLHPSELGANGDQEGVPNSMLEAMASGLPALATTHGGIAEAVENGVSGLLVPERDHEGLAAAMLKLAADPGAYEKMSAAAGARVASVFDLRAQVTALEEIYAEALRPPITN